MFEAATLTFITSFGQFPFDDLPQTDGQHIPHNETHPNPIKFPKCRLSFSSVGAGGASEEPWQHHLLEINGTQYMGINYDH